MIDDISPPGSWVRELSARPHTYRDVWAALREAEARLAAVEAERDALRADRDRLDWLTSQLFDSHWDGGIGNARTWRVVAHHRHVMALMRGDTLDAAIDAAREAT